MKVICLIFLFGGIIYLNAIEKRKEYLFMFEEKITSLLAEIDSVDQQTCMKILSNIDVERNNVSGILLTKLGTVNSINEKAALIYLIGRYKLDDCVNDLIQYIDFNTGDKPMKGPLPLWEQYPAMEALINIGLPSINPVIELLSKETDKERCELALKILRYLKDAEFGKFILEEAIKKEEEKGRKSLLENALKKYCSLYY